MIETTRTAIPSSNYRQSLDILSLGLNGSRTPSFILVRKHTSLSSHIGLAIPVKNMAELAEGFENGTSYASLQESIVKTRMQSPPDEYGLRYEPRAGLAYLDFQNAFCFDQDNMVDAGYITQVEGKTNEDEYGRIQLLINKLMLRPEEVIHKAFAQFLSTSEPAPITIKPNSVWDVLLKNRGTPTMAAADFLSHLEATRIRVQALMDLHRIPVNVAKQLLVDYMKSDDKFNGAGSFKLSNYYETLTRSLPNAAFKEGGEFDRLQKRDDLKKEMALDEDFIYSDDNRPKLTSLYRGNTSGALKVLLKAGYLYLEDVLSDCAHGTIWHKLDFEDKVEAEKVTKGLSALYFAAFRQAIPPAAEQPIDPPEIEENIPEIPPVITEESVEDPAPLIDEPASLETPETTSKPAQKSRPPLSELYQELRIYPETQEILNNAGYQYSTEILRDLRSQKIWDKIDFQNKRMANTVIADLKKIYATRHKHDFVAPYASVYGKIEIKEEALLKAQTETISACVEHNKMLAGTARVLTEAGYEYTDDILRDCSEGELLNKLTFEREIDAEFLRVDLEDLYFYRQNLKIEISQELIYARLKKEDSLPEPEDSQKRDPLDISIESAIEKGLFQTDSHIDMAGLLSEPVSSAAPTTLREIFELTKDNPQGLKKLFHGVGPVVSADIAEYIGTLATSSEPEDPFEKLTLQEAVAQGYFNNASDEVTDYAGFLSSPKENYDSMNLREIYAMVSSDPKALAGKFESVGPGISQRLAAKIINVVEQGIKVPALS